MPNTTSANEYLFARAIPEPMSGCWLWSGYVDDIGYGRAGHPTENKAHRIIWTILYGAIPSGKKILHKCDVRCCINPDHLFIGTQADNVADMMKKGRNKCVPQCGEKNPMSRLTNDVVLKMRKLRESTNEPYHKIASKFGVSTMTAYRAITKKAWSEI